jgi:hypothetical protein
MELEVLDGSMISSWWKEDIYIHTRCDTHLRGPKIGWDPCRAPRKMYSQSEREACLASVSTSDFRSPLGFVDD